MFDLDILLGREPRNAGSLLEEILSLSAAMSFIRAPVMIGPGTRNYHKDGGKWSGKDVRAMNVKNGVGSRILREARQHAAQAA